MIDMYCLNKDLVHKPFPIGIFTITNFFSDTEIANLFEYTNRLKQVKAGIQKDNHPNFIHYDEQKHSIETEYRNNKICWIKYDETNFFIRNLFQKIFNKIIDVNQSEFGFYLTDVEPFQFTSYEVGDYYKPHLDLNGDLGCGNLQRKLSFSIQLSDEKDYSGGDLCCYTSNEPIIASKLKGSISFFPSFLLHEVKEVTMGKRYSLVGWVHGPKFI